LSAADDRRAEGELPDLEKLGRNRRPGMRPVRSGTDTAVPCRAQARSWSCT